MGHGGWNYISIACMELDLFVKFLHIDKHFRRFPQHKRF
jgi:hypothetical protein